MAENYQKLFTDNFLLANWNTEYQKYLESTDDEVLGILRNWNDKNFQKETEAEGAFVDIFFKKIWNFKASGETKKEEGYTCHPQFPVPNAGQKGGTGKADLAMGYFGKDDAISQIPQIVCEFKDIRSGLDNEQNRKGNRRSPVKQCADYLREANSAFAPYGHEPVRAKWAIVTDMNEFRLYSQQSIPHQYQKFVINSPEAETTVSLIEDSKEAALQRFFFRKLFQADSLLTQGGPCTLEKFIKDQFILEKELEKGFYKEYQAFRENVFQVLVKANPDFNGTKGKLVRMTQRLLDRCLFIMFCEDMGSALNFPTNLLRDVLIKHSMDEFYDPDDNMAWEKVKKLFSAMKDGTPFLKHKINRFNGGLFADEPELEQLNVPTILFCTEHQGAGEKSLFSHKETLLYLSSKYNFGAKGNTQERSIGLYTLGRIFEQSITDLEYMEAKADGRVSITELSKRKRNGVYYTPEWVTHYIVEETVGARLEDIKKEMGFDSLPPVTDQDINNYQERLKDKRKKGASHVNEYLNLIDKYRFALDKIKVVDPSCGSGAFLIQAFERLFRERQWIAREKERIEQVSSLFDTEQEMKSVLSNNLFGVDINSESVEITRLALWLRTALPNKPLGVLDKNILCGNSLVGSDFYNNKSTKLFSEENRELVNIFDWDKAFPEIFKNGGFDCVIGNPPYIKLQHFRKAQPEVTEYLLTVKKENGSLKYESAQTGNFDMYLPFIEMGIELLNEKGRMGYIAPNVWMMNEYGKGLRNKLKRTKRLDRWIDFKSFQVFDEAITYTALQFFKGKACDEMKCYFAPDGDISNLDWRSSNIDSITINDFPENDKWQILPIKEKQLIDNLLNNNSKLGEQQWTNSISQGLISGAFRIYVNKKISENKYEHINSNKKCVEIELEDKITKPIVSGEHIKRYEKPLSEQFIIFPYRKVDKNIQLIEFAEMEIHFPSTLNFLKINEKFLRKRDGGKLNDDSWYRFSRNQNLDKQEIPKLLIAGTAPNLRVSCDVNGNFATNDKRVYSIYTKNTTDLLYLLGILNSPIPNFVFKNLARPKSGGFFDIETQFLAPLPIPNATDEQKQQVGNMAKELQELHTSRRDKMLLIYKRLQSAQTATDKRKPEWIWTDAKDKDALEKRLETLSAYLRPGAKMKAENDNGEIKYFIDDIPVIEGIFEDEDQSDFITTQWNQTARTTNITEKFTAKKLVALLCSLRKTENQALMKQTSKFNIEIHELDKIIAEKETEINNLIYSLYKLNQEEIKIVESQA